MSQSCDLVKGREKLDEIVFCAVWKRSELTDSLAKVEILEEARKGRLPNVHLIAASTCAGFEREVRIVDFRRVYSCGCNTCGTEPGFLNGFVYSLHIGNTCHQSFARFFMRSWAADRHSSFYGEEEITTKPAVVTRARRGPFMQLDRIHMSVHRVNRRSGAPTAEASGPFRGRFARSKRCGADYRFAAAWGVMTCTRSPSKSRNSGAPLTSGFSGRASLA